MLLILRIVKLTRAIAVGVVITQTTHFDIIEHFYCIHFCINQILSIGIVRTVKTQNSSKPFPLFYARHLITSTDRDKNNNDLPIIFKKKLQRIIFIYFEILHVL